jgi:hypothetical protein
VSSNAEVKTASYFGPLAGTTPTDGNSRGNNPIRRPTSESNTSEALATATINGRTVVLWAGQYVDICNEDLVNPLEYSFSFGAQAITYGQTGTFATGNAATGERLMPGERVSRIVPPDATYVNFRQPAGVTAATVLFRRSEGNVPVT